jgi:hypothetical protein
MDARSRMEAGCCNEVVSYSVRYHMPRYFFNTRIGRELISDPTGIELRNPDRAWEQAREMIVELLKAEGARSELLQAVIEVTNEQGEIVLEFPFTEALLDPGRHHTSH